MSSFEKNIRQVCEAILTSEKLEYENEVFWCHSFILIHKIISSADYKGVRDQLKIMLDKVHSIPCNSNISGLAQLNAMFKVSKLLCVELLFTNLYPLRFSN